jgi:CBS domain-containing protein
MNVATILKHKGGGVFTTATDKSLLDIAQLLAQHGIGCIVIVGDDDKIAGIMSERDLMRAIGQAGPKVLNEPVSNFMTKTVVTAGEANTSDQLMSANDDEAVSPHTRGREGSASRPHLYRRPGQDPRRGSRV